MEVARVEQSSSRSGRRCSWRVALKKFAPEVSRVLLKPFKVVDSAEFPGHVVQVALRLRGLLGENAQLVLQLLNVLGMLVRLLLKAV